MLIPQKLDGHMIACIDRENLKPDLESAPVA